MSHRYQLESAYLPQGWVHGAVVTVSAAGLITHVALDGAAADDPAWGGTAPHAPHIQRIDGIVVPGMPNAHSHAFQRAMAGNAEYRTSAQDSFWTWRDAMYALANRLEPDDLEVIATQLFVEMLEAGYTSVAEFHYLHRRRDGACYADHNDLWEAVTAAAHGTGIGLTLLPTLYQSSDFGAVPLKTEQQRFRLETDQFLRAIEKRVGTQPRDGANLIGTGAAFHSLRAVPYEVLREATLALRDIDPALPVHIHVAEQIKEVKSCQRETGHRPIELLLHSGLLTQYWCLVHATHATAEELRGIAAHSATVCASISTEANLGDGFFDAPQFLAEHGRLCVGSDSQATVSPAEELRWLEYEHRLRRRRRGVLASAGEAHVGTRLWSEAAVHGAQAIGQPVGAIAVGRRADWLVLDPEHPSLAGAAPETALDHLVFAGAERAIRDVMVAGQLVVKHGRHRRAEAARERFTALMRRLGAAPPTATGA